MGGDIQMTRYTVRLKVAAAAVAKTKEAQNGQSTAKLVTVLYDHGLWQAPAVIHPDQRSISFPVWRCSLPPRAD